MAVTTSFTVQTISDSSFGDQPSGNSDVVGLDDQTFITVADSGPGATFEIYRVDGQLQRAGYEPGLSDPTVSRHSNTAAYIAATSSTNEIKLFRFDQTGLAYGPNLGAGTNADIAEVPAADRVGVAWQRNYGGSDNDIVVGFLDGDLTVRRTFTVDSTTANDRNASVGYLPDGGFVVAWDRTSPAGASSIWFAIYNDDGTVRSAPAQVDALGTTNRNPSVAVDAYGGFAISYEDSESGHSEIAVYTVANAGRDRGYEQVSAFQSVSGDPSSTAIGLVDATAFTLSIFDSGEVRDSDIYLSLTDPLTGEALTSPANPIAIDVGGGPTLSPSITSLPGERGRFVITYSDDAYGEIRQRVAMLVETITGDAASNTLAGRSRGAVHIDAGGGNDTIYDSGNDDRLLGSTGDDTIWNGSGNDHIDGGKGVDTVYLTPDGVPHTVDLRITGPQNTGNGMDTLIGIENVVGVASVSDTLIGNDRDNILNGLGLFAGLSFARDTLAGGRGNDTYIVGTTDSIVIEASNQGSADLVRSLADFTLPKNVENLTLLDSAARAGTGNALANSIVGTNFDNVIDGKQGADRMQGLGGADTYYVDDAGDKVIEAAGGGADRVLSSVSYTLTPGQEIETLKLASSSSTAALKLYGNGFDNTLVANAGANTLDGKQGADRMQGLGGADTYYVDDADDKVIEAVGGGGDRVLSSIGYTLTSGQEIETLKLASSSSKAALQLVGNAFDNTLIANAGANILDGKAGADLLRGLDGRDTFVFSTALGGGNVDHLVDFSAADDTIQLSKAVFKVLATGELPAQAFKDLGAPGARLGADDRILYDSGTGVLSYDADGSGTASKTVQFAIVDTRVKLSAHDFFVV